MQLTYGNSENSPDCSPDGLWVYYCSTYSPGGVESIRGGPVWKVPIDGGDSVLVIDNETAAPVVSPDQKLVAFNYFDLQANPPFGIEVDPVAGGQSVKRFNLSNWPFCWTPDGRALAYLDDRSLNIWAQPLDPAQLTNFKADQTFFFAWSGDGKQLALARGTLTSDVVLIRDFK